MVRNQSLVLIGFVCVGAGCSSDVMKRTTYDTLQNVREQQCSKKPSVDCEKRERFEAYEQQRLSKDNTE